MNTNRTELSEAKRRLLQRVLRGELAHQHWDAPIVPRGAGAAVPLAASQHQVWLHSQMAPSAPIYNEPITIRYRGWLDRDVLQRSFNELLRRHEIWRSAFASVEGRVIQVVQNEMVLTIPFADLTTYPESEREAEAARIATAEARRSFDLAVGPLLRATLLKLGERDYRLHITLHHIIFDGVSIFRVLLPELSAIYQAFSENAPSPLPEPRVQYADYSLWQHRVLKTDAVNEQLNYWRKQLAGDLPSSQLPADRARPAQPSYRGAIETFSLSKDLTAAVHQRSRAAGVTPYMFLLAAFKTLIYRYTGQDDLIVGGVTDGRRRAEFQNLMGFFLNSVVLRTHPTAAATFRDYLTQVKETVVGALANSAVPFDRVVRELQPKRDLSRHPLFQVMFSVEPSMAQVDSAWDLAHGDIDTGAAKFDLYFSLYERRETYTGRFVYNTDLFDGSTMRRLIAHWTAVVEAVVRNPEVQLSEIELLSLREERDLAATASGPRRAIPATTIHGLFEAQVEATPDNVAVETETAHLTYRQLNDAANRLARRLVECGAGPGTLIGLCVERSCAMATAMLAILKSGSAYLPLDPSLPKERMAFSIEDAKITLLLTDRSLASQLQAPGIRLIFSDEAEGRAENLKPASPADLAYVIYTSGSTGKPKGVEIPHSAAVNLLASMQHEPGFSKWDTMLAVTTLSFDIAALEIFLPLATGGRLEIATLDEARDPQRLMERIRDSRCTVMQATPATWRALVDAGWDGDGKLKILCGGEALSRDLANALAPRCHQLWNMYGPTETTIWSAIQKIEAGDATVSIGRPIANTEILVLDRNNHPLPVGVIGELYIGGSGLARGYLRRKVLTREKFIDDPRDPQKRLYRTGDLGRRRADGTLECLGRTDHQVKIRGFRIELEEVEACIASHPGVRGAAVKASSDAAGHLALTAYVVGSGTQELRAYLQKRLPEYMIPSRFVSIDALPRTANGKLDRKALPEAETLETSIEYSSPRSALEKRLTGIFESILEIPRVGVRDNFFDIGGHSLLAAKLLRRIELEFGQRLSLTAIFQAPTVEQLALALSNPSAGRGRVVTLQNSDGRLPLFWIFGGVEIRPLAASLAGDHPVISIGLEAHEEPGQITAAAVAGTLIAKLRAIQPEGPYHLAGWCAAGVFAYEMARQLAEAGQKVNLVALVSVPNPAYFRSLPDWRRTASKVAHHVRTLTGLRGNDARTYLLERMQGLRKKLAPRSVALDRKVARLQYAALMYTPAPYDGRIALFQPALRPNLPDLPLGWSTVAAGRFDIFDIPGDHCSMFAEPNVHEMVARLKSCMKEAAPARPRIAAQA